MTEQRLSSSPSKGSTHNLYKETESDFCKRCSRYIYPLELMGPVMGYKYHKLCFRCHTCDRLLDFINYRTNMIDLNDKQIYCVNHNPKNGKYSEIVYSYRSGSKSPGRFETTEYSTEYHRETKSHDGSKYIYGDIPDDLTDIYKNLSDNQNSHGIGWRSNIDSNKMDNYNNIKINRSSSEDMLNNNNHHHHLHHHQNQNSFQINQQNLHEIKSEIATNVIEDHLVKLLTDIRNQNSTTTQQQSTYHHYDNLNTNKEFTIPIRRDSDSSHEIKVINESTTYIDEDSNDNKEQLKRIIYELMQQDYDNTKQIVNKFETNKNQNYSSSTYTTSYSPSRSPNLSRESNQENISNLKNIVSGVILASAVNSTKPTYNSTSSYSSQPSTPSKIPTTSYDTWTYNDPEQISNLRKIASDIIKQSNITTNSTNKLDSFSSSSYNKDFNSSSSTFTNINQTETNLKNIYSEAYNKNQSTSSLNNYVSNDSNLKTIYKEATLASNTRSNSNPILVETIRNQDSNLKDMYYEAAILNEQRSKNSTSNLNQFTTNTLPPNIVYDEQYEQTIGEDENLKDIYYEATIAAASRGHVNNQLVNEIKNSQSSMHQLNSSSSNITTGSVTNMSNSSSSQIDPNLKQIWVEAAQSYQKQVHTNNISMTQQHIRQEKYESKMTSSTTIINSGTSSSSSTNLNINSFDLNKNDSLSHNNLKQVMNEVIRSDLKSGQNQSTIKVDNVQLAIPDPENMSNLKRVTAEIIEFNKLKKPSETFNTNLIQNTRPAQQIDIPVQISDPENMTNLKKIVADVLNTDLKVKPTTYVPSQSTTNTLNKQPSTNRQISDGVPIDIERNENREIIGENKGLGVVRITVQYDEIRTRLSISVHEARQLKNIEAKGLIDPYARIYLLPDEKPSFKRKTKIIKNSLNPRWQETFDYSIPMTHAIGKQLVVNLKDERGFFEKQEAKFLGEVVLKLKSVPDIASPFTRWYYLQPTNSNANMLQNISVKSF